MPPALPSTSADQTEGLPNIGIRLRYARRERRLRLKDLADAAGCSESMLSRIENNLVMPSLTTLHRLCSVLDLSVPELLSARDPNSLVIYRDGERPTYSNGGRVEGDGTRAEILVPFEEGRMLEAHIWHCPARGGWSGPFEHAGEEVGYVLEGSVELKINNEVHLIHKGDSFFFRSDLAHSYRCYGDEDCRIVWINTPPTF